MEIKNGWWLAAAFVIWLVSTVIGFGMGMESTQKDCERIGTFYRGESVYDCHKRPQSRSGSQT